MHKYKLFKSPHDHRDHFFTAISHDIKLPASFNLRDQMPHALDQGNLGSCASNVASNVLRFLLKKEHLKEFQPSRLYIYWNTRVNIENSPPNQDTGVCIRDVCKSLNKYHVCDEILCPYDISKFSVAPSLLAYKNANLHKKIRYVSVPQNLTSIKHAILLGIPIMIGIQIYENFESIEVAKTGIVPMPDVENENHLGGHAVTLVGYDDNTKRFTCLNSWGPVEGELDGWGDHGYFTIPYDYILDSDLAQDFWQITFFE
jgi:C1A family cysteine protease